MREIANDNPVYVRENMAGLSEKGGFAESE